MLREARDLMAALDCKHRTRHVDVIPAPWNLTRALMEYNRMLGFSISRPIVRFRGLEEAGHLPKNAEGEAEPSLLEIWDPVSSDIGVLPY